MIVDGFQTPDKLRDKLMTVGDEWRKPTGVPCSIALHYVESVLVPGL